MRCETRDDTLHILSDRISHNNNMIQDVILDARRHNLVVVSQTSAFYFVFAGRER